MISFLDGPAKGTKLQLRRAPLFLRVVIDRRDKKQIDALDQLNDEADKHEDIFVYRSVGLTTRYHLLVRGKHARSRGGFWGQGEYRLYDTQPDDKTMRDNTLWQEWCHAQPIPDEWKKD